MTHTVHTKHLSGRHLLRAPAIVWVMLLHSFLVGGLGPGFECLSRHGWAAADICAQRLLGRRKATWPTPGCGRVTLNGPRVRCVGRRPC